MNTIKTYLQNNVGAVILGGALIIAVIVGGIFYTTKSTGSNTLTVTGSAKMQVNADNVIWRSSISRSVYASELKTGYAQMSSDVKLVQAFMNNQGIPETAITITPITVNEEWNQDTNAPKRYTLRQNIEVKSEDVNGLTVIAKKVDILVEQGVFYQTDSVEYYYSKLNEARVNLLTDAISDAQSRAQAMAKSSGSRVGKLASASSGVVQVLSRGAIDNGEYGQYDTSKIEKDISVTVRATFKVK